MLRKNSKEMLEKYKQNYKTGVWDKNKVYDMVMAGYINQEDYLKITHETMIKSSRPEPRKVKIIETVTSDGLNPLRTTRNFDWCNLLENGTLEFGEEQGNYAGGTTLSYNYYGNHDSFPLDHPKTEEYWECVKRRLNHSKEYQKEFYLRIKDMCNRHGILKDYDW